MDGDGQGMGRGWAEDGQRMGRGHWGWARGTEDVPAHPGTGAGVRGSPRGVPSLAGWLQAGWGAGPGSTRSHPRWLAELQRFCSLLMC